MIQILLKGVDEFLGAHIEKELTPNIAKICDVKNDDIYFISLHSIIYHQGVDQTSFHMIMQIELEEKYRKNENELVEYLLNASKKFAVHCHIQINYSNGNVYERIDKSYPLFVTSSNQVEIEDDNEDDNEEDEIYTGNIFEDFEARLKENGEK